MSLSCTLEADAKYSGLNNILASSSAGDYSDVLADIEGEQETIPDLAPADYEDDDDDDDDNEEDEDEQPQSAPAISGGLPSQWEEALSSVGKGVTEETHREYIRLSEAAVSFFLSNKLINTREQFLSKNPLENADKLIVAWIMHQCDSIALDGKPVTGPRGSYTHAQKMRASMTHVFSRILGLGSQHWQCIVGPDGKVTTSGNPSVSDRVSTYMVGLRRRKVKEGETTTSARAITHEIMEKFYDYNHLSENWTMYDDRQVAYKWGGPTTRRLAQAVYTIMFLCLLRVDEVLKIKMEHIVFEEKKVILTLPFRKTHQFGEIKPFVLHLLPEEEAYLCPVRALADWIAASGITSGYLFRRMASGDRPSAKDSPMAHL